MKRMRQESSSDFHLGAQTSAILSAAIAFIIFLSLAYFKVVQVIDKIIPLQEQYVQEVRTIARNTAAPTLGTSVVKDQRPYAIVFPQRDGVTDEEWVQCLESKINAVKGAQ